MIVDRNRNNVWLNVFELNKTLTLNFISPRGSLKHMAI